MSFKDLKQYYERTSEYEKKKLKIQNELHALQVKYDIEIEDIRERLLEDVLEFIKKNKPVKICSRIITIYEEYEASEYRVEYDGLSIECFYDESFLIKFPNNSTLEHSGLLGYTEKEILKILNHEIHKNPHYVFYDW